MQFDSDFEVFKALTIRRLNEQDSVNDVLRRLLDLPPIPTELNTATKPEAPGCVFKGVHFAAGTRFRSTFKGRVYYGEIKGSEWRDEAGNVFTSPSQAAFAITRHGVNGWTFWECKRPTDTDWVRIVTLRPDYVPIETFMAERFGIRQ